MTFTVHRDDGVEMAFEVLFALESPETGKNYLLYTDNTLDEYGGTKVYASSFDPEAAEPRLEPIEAEEWAAIEDFLDQLQ